MRRFGKIFLWQMLRICLIILGMVIGLTLAIYVSSWLPQGWIKITLPIFATISILIAFAAPFLFEYRNRLT